MALNLFFSGDFVGTSLLSKKSMKKSIETYGLQGCKRLHI